MRLMLWFDVILERHTTRFLQVFKKIVLWFDVILERHTTQPVQRRS